MPDSKSLFADPATAIEGGATLIDLEFDPLELSRAVTMATAFAALHGTTPDERERARLVVEAGTMYLATDFDESTTRTTDGRTRPLRFRYSQPTRDTVAAETVTWVGARVRLAELLRALRNKVENSELYSVLDRPARLQIRANDEGTGPAQITIVPGEGVSRQPRTIDVVGGVDRAEIMDLAPRTPTGRVGDLSSDLLLDMGTVASEAVGVYVHPGSASESGYVAGVGRGGIVAASFVPAEPALFDAAVAEGRLREPAVLSGRLATTLGFVQESVTAVATAQATARVAQEIARVQSAFVAAALDEDAEADPRMLGALYQQAGMPSATAIVEAVPGSSSVFDDAAAFAGRIRSEASDPAAVAETLERLLPLERLTTVVRTVLAEQVPDELAARLAAAWVAAQGDRTAIVGALAVALGEGIVADSARSIVGAHGDLRRPDLAVGAVRAAGRRAPDLLAQLLPQIDDDRLAAWWESCESYLSQLHVDPAVVADLRAARGRSGSGRPLAKWIRVPESLRQSWIATAQGEQRGRLWSEEDGRVGAGWQLGGAGTLMISDLAVEPDPARYPIAPEAVRAHLAGAPSEVPAVEATVYSNDIHQTARRVVGLTNPDRAVSGQPGMVQGPVFLARWVAAGEAAADPAETFTARQREIVTPETAWTSADVNAPALSLPRRAAEFPVLPAAVAGTLRIYALEPGGERIVLHLPMRAVAPAAGVTQAVAALDADGLQDLVGFAARRGREVVLGFEGDAVRLRDGGGTHVVIVPAVGAERLPAVLRGVARTAGVPERVTPTELTAPVREGRTRTIPVGTASRTTAGEVAIGRLPTLPVRVDGAGMAVPLSQGGAMAILQADSLLRAVDREIAEIDALLAAAPEMTASEAEALVRRAGGVGEAFSELLATPAARRVVLGSTAVAPARALVALLRERGLPAPDLEGETLDLFGGMAAANAPVAGADDAAVVAAWRTFLGAWRRSRAAFVRRRQGFQTARGVRAPVARGAMRPEAAQAPIVAPDEGMDSTEEAPAVVRRRLG